MTSVIKKISVKISKSNIDIGTKFRLFAEVGRLRAQYRGERMPIGAQRGLSLFVKD